MESVSQNTQISAEPETQGFDLSVGKTWIYPENFPVRKYQFDIVQTTLYNNTLVCLPTGLGKTFIAAVVMYNFWRWYPRGKVVFLAPTKPLVAQQIHACHNIMGIPSTETIELTGAINKKQREASWLKKRVIFATPQVFHNDLENNTVPAELVKCVVVDEAHKALGKHSYCECIRILSDKNPYFRVLALSATPGNKIDNVREILQNLHITNLELRDETSIDIVPYINHRKTDIIVVPLSKELEQFKETYIIIMDRHVRVLLQNNVLQSDTANISKGRIFHLMKEFQKKTNKSGNYGQIVKTLNILMTMYHAYELMVRDGLRAFHKFYQNHSDKFWMNSEFELQDLLEDIEAYLGPFPDTKSISDGHIPDIPPNIVFGHTKFDKLKELLLAHFKSFKDKEADTRAIVFVEYRDIVHEVYILLLQSQPLIRPQIFVGQAGLKQKQQIKALEDFRSNRVNVLVSTSIGEEGLDVGEVDLIICFDISQQSPTRLVQRMGRTGRKRDGHIIILVTSGREHETLKSTMARRDSINGRILNTSNIFSSLYENNPRMIPKIFQPECHKIFINVEPKTPAVKGQNKKEKKEKPVKGKGKRQGLDKKAPTTTPSVTQVKNVTQFSMTRFLKNDVPVEPSRDIFKTQNCKKSQTTQINNAIKPCDVKLLSRDDEAIDFLTLCALKKSERETNAQSTRSANALYVRPSAAIPNFFNFSIPDIKILDCLSRLEDMTLMEQKTYATDDDNETVKENYDYIPSAIVGVEPMDCIDDFTCNRKSIGESRFEDLLDESSCSDDVEILEFTEENTCTKSAFAPAVFSEIDRLPAATDSKTNDLDGFRIEDLLNDNSCSNDVEILEFTEKNTCVKPAFAPAVFSESDRLPAASDSKAIDLEDLQPGILEDILNDTSDSSDNDSCTNSLNEAQHEQYEDHNGTTVAKALDHHQKQSFVSECKAINNTADSSPEKKLLERSELNERSMLGITQAIDEIARINSNLNEPEEYVESEDDIFEIVDNTDEAVNNSAASSTFGAFTFDDNNKPSNVAKGDESFNAEESSAAPNDTHATDSIEKEVGDFDWDDDVDVCTTTVKQSCSFVNTIPPCSTPATSNKTNRKTLNFEDELDSRSSSDAEWISVDPRSRGETKGNSSNMSIAKKLAAAKKTAVVKFDKSEVRFDGADNSEDDFMLDKNELKEIIDFENTYFNRARSGQSKKTDATNDYTDEEDLSAFFTAERRNERENARMKFKENTRLKTKAPDRTKTSSLDRHIGKQRGNSRSKFRKRIKSDFVCDEAEVSSDCDTSGGSSGADEDLDGFVSHTQYAPDTSDMRAHYLQSIRSPVKRHNGFLFKKPRSPDPNIEIYSQASPEPQDSYLYDSFCVAGDEEQSERSSRFESYSLLEEAERMLERTKRKRSGNDDSSDNAKRVKKKANRRNILNNSVSSEDETERMRQQVQDESMLRKQICEES